MKTFKSLLVTGMLTAVSTLATNQASAVFCNATVTQVAVGHTGNVHVSTSGSMINLTSNALCSLTTTVGAGDFRIDPRACDKMHSLFLAALLSRRAVTLFFTGDTCPTFPAWVDAYPNSNQFYTVVIN